MFEYIFTLQGTAVLWKSNKQSLVTLFSTEAEYLSSSEAAREGIWLHGLLNDFIDPQQKGTVAETPETSENAFAKTPGTCEVSVAEASGTYNENSAIDPPQLLYMDNKSAMKIVMSSASQIHERTKHIHIRYHFVGVAYLQGRIQIEYLPTAEMTADILTKALPRDTNQRLVKGMGIR
jgi:hypothetical protein